MKQISAKYNFDFMGRRKLAMIVSVVLLAVSVGSLVSRGLNFGIDFTGGVLLEVGYEGYVGQEFIPTRDPLVGLTEAMKLCDV